MAYILLKMYTYMTDLIQSSVLLTAPATYGNTYKTFRN